MEKLTRQFALCTLCLRSADSLCACQNVMKRARLSKTLMERATPFFKTGVLREPEWWKAVAQVPPYVPRPYGYKLKEMRHPTDRLVRKHQDRNPQVLREPLWLGHDGPPTLSHMFAKRQYALMQKGVPEEDAYAQAEAALSSDRQRDLEAVRRMVEEAAQAVGGGEGGAVEGGGVRPAMVADEAVHAGLLQWKAMLVETRYNHWDRGAQVSLDSWLMSQVAGWDEAKLKHAREAADGTMEAMEEEMKRLRAALFPETVATRPGLQGTQHFHTVLRAGIRDNPDWRREAQEFARMVEEVPEEEEWEEEDRERLDIWLVDHCIHTEVLQEVTKQVAAMAGLPAPPLGRQQEEKEEGGGDAAVEGWTDEDIQCLEQQVEEVVNLAKCELFPKLKLEDDEADEEDPGWLWRHLEEEEGILRVPQDEQEVRSAILEEVAQERRSRDEDHRLRWEQAHLEAVSKVFQVETARGTQADKQLEELIARAREEDGEDHDNAALLHPRDMKKKNLKALGISTTRQQRVDMRKAEKRRLRQELLRMSQQDHD